MYVFEKNFNVSPQTNNSSTSRKSIELILEIQFDQLIFKTLSKSHRSRVRLSIDVPTASLSSNRPQDKNSPGQKQFTVTSARNTHRKRERREGGRGEKGKRGRTR